VLKFGRAGARRLTSLVDRLISQGHDHAWAPEAFRELAQVWPLRAVLTAGLPWTEVDFPEDLARARTVVAQMAPAEQTLRPCA
jgi:choline kinase